MPYAKFLDTTTGKTVIGIDFGGSYSYDAGGTIVRASAVGGTSVTITDATATLEPLGLTTALANYWTVVSHENIGTANWTITVQNTATQETKSGVLPFNLSGQVYELECDSGVWVMASCGGYKVESSWDGQQTNEVYRLKGTGEIIKISL